MVIRIEMNKMTEGDEHLDTDTTLEQMAKIWSTFVKRVS